MPSCGERYAYRPCVGPCSPRHGTAGWWCGVVPTRRAGASPAGPPSPTFPYVRRADDACARVLARSAQIRLAGLARLCISALVLLETYGEPTLVSRRSLKRVQTRDRVLGQQCIIRQNDKPVLGHAHAKLRQGGHWSGSTVTALSPESGTQFLGPTAGRPGPSIDGRARTTKTAAKSLSAWPCRQWPGVSDLRHTFCTLRESNPRPLSASARIARDSRAILARPWVV